MKILKNRKIAILLLLLTALLYLVLSFLVKFPLKNISHRIWDGYYILAVEENAPVLPIIEDLQQIGEWEVLSKYNSKIKVFSYNDDLFIPVSKLETFYLDEDPLYDNFLKKLPLLFTGKVLSENYEIIYIKSNLSSAHFSRKINQIMDNYSSKWVLPEIKLVQESMSIFIFIFAVLIMFILYKELWPILLPGIVPWFIFSSGSGLPGVLASIIFLFSLVLLGSILFRSFRHYLNLGIFDPVDKKKLFLSIFIMILSFVYLLINLKTLPYIGSFIFAVAAHFSSITFYVIILDYKRKKQQHRIFFPLKINLNNKKINRPDLYCFSWLILIIILSPLLINENKFESDIKLPVPIAIEGVSDFSQTSLQILHKHSIQSELPNFSDYISHMMYLETYAYGFKYSFPNTEGKLSISQFVMTREGLKEKNVNIYMFTDLWYESIMSPSLTAGIISLLLSQGTPTLVGYQSEFGDLLAGNYIRNHYWFSMFLVVALLMWLSNVSLSGRYVLKEFLLRRKQQAV